MVFIRDVHPGDAEAIVGLLNPIIEAGPYTAFVSPFTVSDEQKFIQDFPS